MHALDPLDPDVWDMVRRTVARGSRSSLHCAIASTGPDGHAYVSPIGSVRLGEPGRATYLDVFNAHLRSNLDRDPRVTVMAVDSRWSAWGRALLRGRFDSPPGVRLIGEVSPARPATDDEIRSFERAVRPALRTRGGRAMWGRLDALTARDLTFSGVVPVRIGTMTQRLWPAASRESTRPPLTLRASDRAAGSSG